MHTQEIQIKVLKTATAELAAALHQLTLQLASKNPLDASEQWLKKLLEFPGLRLLIATEQEKVVGMLTLICYPLLTGSKAWIEDVVVDEQWRGRGIARRLTEEAIRLAGQDKIPTLSLTSHPSREAANRLYPKLGFTLYPTNYYKLSLQDKPKS